MYLSAARGANQNVSARRFDSMRPPANNQVNRPRSLLPLARNAHPPLHISLPSPNLRRPAPPSQHQSLAPNAPPSVPSSLPNGFGNTEQEWLDFRSFVIQGLGQELAHIVLVHRGQAGERDRRQRAQNGRQSRCSAFVGQQARPVHVQGLLRWST